MNLSLSFSVAIVVGIWVNLLTSDIVSGHGGTTMSWLAKRYNLLVLTGICLLWMQARYNRWVECLPAAAVRNVLELAAMYLVEHARKHGTEIHLHEMRGFFHAIKTVRPGDKCDKEMCLTPIEHFCQRPQDRGPIPIGRRSYQAWYVNIKSLRSQAIVSEQPDRTKRPFGDDLYINVPSQFPSTSVIACPVWKNGIPPIIGGVITFDCARTLHELDWPDTPSGRLSNSQGDLYQALNLVAETIANIYWSAGTNERV